MLLAVFILSLAVLVLSAACIKMWCRMRGHKSSADYYAERFHTTWDALDQCTEVGEALKRDQLSRGEAWTRILEARSKAMTY